MAVWRGGRGVKAPYETTHVRVPLPIKDQVEEIVQSFKDGRLAEKEESMSIDEAVENARRILKQKKSARVSMESLLTAIYRKDVCL